MYRNYRLYAAIALFALAGATVKGDMFDALRPSDQREISGGAQRPTIIPGVVDVDTASGTKPEVKPLEWLTGGRRGGDYENHDYYGNDRGYNRYDNYR